MGRCLRIVIVVFCATLAAGCAAPLGERSDASSHLPIGKKHEFILHSKATLKNFQNTAIDLRSRRKPQVLHEFAGEVKNYMEVQVEPIVIDSEAGQNLETRLEIAKLQLLAGMVYVELTEYRQARQLLEAMETRYGNQAEILTASLDRNDIGFASLEAGLQNMKERIARETARIPLLQRLPIAALPLI